MCQFSKIWVSKSGNANNNGGNEMDMDYNSHNKDSSNQHITDESELQPNSNLDENNFQTNQSVHKLQTSIESQLAKVAENNTQHSTREHNNNSKSRFIQSDLAQSTSVNDNNNTNQKELHVESESMSGPTQIEYVKEINGVSAMEDSSNEHPNPKSEQNSKSEYATRKTGPEEMPFEFKTSLPTDMIENLHGIAWLIS